MRYASDDDHHVLPAPALMPSTFTWVDLSDRERRKMLDAIDRFKEKDTRDELGLGTIRDTFADLFFPGTSVVQSRVRYFLFVPWLYRLLAQKRTAGNPAAEMRKLEVKMIDALLGAGEREGVIGRLSKSSLQRLPSNVYWLGMRTWGVSSFAGLQDDYHRNFAKIERTSNVLLDDDEQFVHGKRGAWHPAIPRAPKDFPEQATFELQHTEAQFLQERLIDRTRDSALAFFARKWQDADAPYVWEHPLAHDLPKALNEATEHARCFALAARGAALVYVLLLQQKRGAKDLVGTVRENLSMWASAVTSDHRFGAWDRVAFWDLVKRRARVAGSSQQFFDSWLALAPWRRADGGADHAATRTLVEQREISLKGNRSRLKNPRALELWGGDAADATMMDFRWNRARSFLTDIHAGLAKGDNDA